MTTPSRKPGQDIYNVLAQEIWDSYSSISFCRAGSKFLHQEVERIYKRNYSDIDIASLDPEPRLHIMDDPPPHAGIDEYNLGSWSRSDLTSAGEEDGWLTRWLSDAWVSLMHSRWENHYRPALAAAIGLTSNSIFSESMSDIRRLRNDVIHHQGIASKRNAGKCEVLKGITVGERITVRPCDIKLLLRELKIGVPEAAEFDEHTPGISTSHVVLQLASMQLHSITEDPSR